MQAKMWERDEKQNTSLCRAVMEGSGQEVQSLLSLGAAASVFVHGPRSGSLMCTLPMTVQPQSDAFPYPTVPFTGCSGEILGLLDEACSQHILQLAKSCAERDQVKQEQDDKVGKEKERRERGETEETPSALDVLYFPDELKVGDFVRRGPSWKAGGYAKQDHNAYEEQVVGKVEYKNRTSYSVAWSDYDSKSTRTWQSGNNSTCTYTYDPSTFRFDVYKADPKNKPAAIPTHSLAPRLARPAEALVVGDLVRLVQGCNGSSLLRYSGSSRAEIPVEDNCLGRWELGRVGVVSRVFGSASAAAGGSSSSNNSSSGNYNSNQRKKNVAVSTDPMPDTHSRTPLSQPLAKNEVNYVVEVVELGTGLSGLYPMSDLAWADGSRRGEATEKVLQARPIRGVATVPTGNLSRNARAPQFHPGVGEQLKNLYVNKSSNVRVIGNIQTYNFLVDSDGSHLWVNAVDTRPAAYVNTPPPSLLAIGDRVRLSPLGTGHAWCLDEGREGVVLYAPLAGESAKAEQRNVQVALAENPAQSFLFRASWLERVPNQGQRHFKLGDRCSLDVASFVKQAPETKGKCLGSPRDLKYGIVTDEGVVRDGMQRCIQVTVVDPDQDVEDIDDATRWTSMYPSYSLVPAVRAIVMCRSDHDRLVASVQRLLASAFPTINAATLVDQFRAGVWSKLHALVLQVAADRADAPTTEDVWQAQRAFQQESAEQPWPEAHEAEMLRSARTHEPAAGAGEGKHCDWACDVCGHVNAKAYSASNCGACGVQTAEWPCLLCSQLNPVHTACCRMCLATKEEALATVADMNVRNQEQLDAAADASVGVVPQGMVVTVHKLAQAWGLSWMPVVPLATLFKDASQAPSVVLQEAMGVVISFWLVILIWAPRFLFGLYPFTFWTSALLLSFNYYNYWTYKDDPDIKLLEPEMWTHSAIQERLNFDLSHFITASLILVVGELVLFFCIVADLTHVEFIQKFNFAVNLYGCVLLLFLLAAALAQQHRLVYRYYRNDYSNDEADLFASVPFFRAWRACVNFASSLLSSIHRTFPSEIDTWPRSVLFGVLPLLAVEATLHTNRFCTLLFVLGVFCGLCYAIIFPPSIEASEKKLPHEVEAGRNGKEANAQKATIKGFSRCLARLCVIVQSDRARFGRVQDVDGDGKDDGEDEEEDEEEDDEDEEEDDEDEEDEEDKDEDEEEDEEEEKKDKKAVNAEAADQETGHNALLAELYFCSPPSRSSSVRSAEAGGAAAEMAGQADSASIQRHYTAAFVQQAHYRPISEIKELTSFCDKNGCSAAHHAETAGLKRTAATLYSLGMSRWQLLNRFHESPALLRLGFCIGTIGSPEVAAMHCALQLNGLASDAFARAAIDTWVAHGSDPPAPLDTVELLQAIRAGQEAEADALSSALCKAGQPHAPLYRALFLRLFGFDVRMSRRLLSEYEANVEGRRALSVDPLYYLARYIVWKQASASPNGVPSRRERLYAADALALLQFYPAVALEWLTTDDCIDNMIDVAKHAENAAQQARGRADNMIDPGSSAQDPDDIDDDGDILPPPGPGDPEALWLLQKTNFPECKSASMDRLMAMVGLKQVKRQAVQVATEVLLRPPADLVSTTSSNWTFLGNPGAGKSSVAALLTAAMVELKFRKNATPVFTSATEILALKDPAGEFADLCDSAEGGSIVIDEFYQFEPAAKGSRSNDSNKVLDVLLQKSVELEQSTTFILCGYREEVLSLLSYNVGFLSRFPREFVFTFEDYSHAQLAQIIRKMASDDGYKFETRRSCGVNIPKELARRIHKGAHKKGFGNARLCKKSLDQCKINQKLRIGARLLHGLTVAEHEYRLLTRGDTVGDRPKLHENPYYLELRGMIGLAEVKAKVEALMNLQMQNFDAALNDEPVMEISLHRVFVGSPGTGKTTVARLWGRLLKDFGLLSDGDIIECTPADLKGQAQGEAASRTKAVLDSAKGKVLFIDEVRVSDCVSACLLSSLSSPLSAFSLL